MYIYIYIGTCGSASPPYKKECRVRGLGVRVNPNPNPNPKVPCSYYVSAIGQFTLLRHLSEIPFKF